MFYVWLRTDDTSFLSNLTDLVISNQANLLIGLACIFLAVFVNPNMCPPRPACHNYYYYS